MITDFHGKYFAHELTRPGRHGVDRLSQSLFDASVDLNPHQVEAALFAMRSPLSKGALLADEVGLGKTIEAGLVLCQYWAERKRRLLVVCPASLRKQWQIELEDKFNLPALVLDSRVYRRAVKDGAGKPRIVKAVYCDEWHSGKPQRRDKGTSYTFKYIRLESYEDALNNITLEDRSSDLLGLPEDVQDDYLLRYSLDIETRASLLDLERFENPFDYKLKVYNRETGEAEPHPVDLPETFNYLLGLRVRTMQMRDGFLVIEGENPAAETVLVIWRNVHENDNAALEAFVTGTLRINPADTEYAAIYINGDTTLDDPHKKILLTEQAFHGLMFDVKGL